MAGMNSRAVTDRRIYAQDMPPTDTRDGVIWVNTSSVSRSTFVYSSDTGDWEPIRGSNLPATLSGTSTLTIPEGETMRVLASFDVTDSAELTVNGELEVI